MKIPESAIAEVVAEASTQVHDAQYITSEVDLLGVSQPRIVQYVVAHQSELTVEAIVQVLFQAALIQRSITAHHGSDPAVVNYAQLDQAAQQISSLEELAEEQPDLASFIASNLDLGDEKANKVGGLLLAHIAQAFVMSR